MRSNFQALFSLSVIACISCIIFHSCGSHNGGNHSKTIGPEEPERAAYFWKTRFELNGYERELLKEHDISKLYVRMFDVDYDTSPAAGLEKVIPIATISFVSRKPDEVEIIPTVFITPRAIISAKNEKGGLETLASKIVTRIGNMMEYNELGAFNELQLDCDWNESTREDFYSLCGLVRDILRKDGRKLSATIRLHQLRQTVPPVDRGVLMIYNTGALRSAGENNSILSLTAVRTYLNLKPVDYDLPLDVAYPTFGWGVWFRGKEYKGILHETDYSESDLYRPETDGTFSVIKEHVLERHELMPGDRIRLETSVPETILEVKELVRKSFPSGIHTNILYHLDSTNLAKYSNDEIEDILDY